MSWRILHIAKSAKLSVKNNQLLYEVIGEDSLTLSLEDIAVIVIESNQVLISSYLISELAEKNIVLFSCDKTHMPNGVFFSYHKNSRFLETAEAQISLNEPFKKRLWQKVVIQKIINQAEVLKLFKLPFSEKLVTLSKEVQSGDSSNIEGSAASIYWKSLFDSFSRNNDIDNRNSFLNYGYAILRGLIARNLSATGLLPVLGIHHNNDLNQFNLADDIIEPFRPFIDIETKHLEGSQELTPEIKKSLISVLTKNCIINNEQVTILKAAETCASSLSKSIKTKNIDYLQLPKMILAKE